jgi:peptidoglycan/xylan/chitin deacetylase (PgdA/CDA1 family)
MTVVNWDVVSGDAIPYASAKVIADQILSHVRPGSIIIMHFNHPQWHEREALERVIPILKKKGYRFVKLKNRL